MLNTIKSNRYIYTKKKELISQVSVKYERLER